MMNISKLLVAIIAAFGAFALIAEPNVAYTENTTVDAALPLDGEYIIDVASGVTVIYTGEISGTGPLRKTGAGTLVLNNGNNSFTAGVQITQGYVRADTAGCLGEGEIFLDGTVTVKDGSNRSCGVTRQIFFNAKDAVFTNKIRIEGRDGKDGYAVTTSFIRTDVNTTLSGDIDFSNLTQVTAHCNASISCGETDSSTAVLTFTKAVSWPGKTLRVNAYGDVRFEAPLVLGSLTVGYNSALGGDITLLSKQNQIANISLNRANIVAGDDFVLSGAAFSVSRGFSSETRSALNLNGKNQVLASLQYDSGSAKNYYSEKSVYVRSSTPATLVLKGASTSRTSYQTLSGKVSLVVDAADYPSFTQTFAGRAHTTTGTLSVSNGTLAVALGATFKKVGEIHVGPSGNLTVDASSALPGMFTGATNVIVDGRMTIGANITNPFTDETVDISLGEKAELSLPAAMVLRVKSLTVNGTRVANKTKWGASGTELAQLKGGTIVVDDGSAEIVNATWTGEGADSSISTAANWDSKSVPDLENATVSATFANGGAEAQIDCNISLYGINLSAANGFTFSKADDSAAISLGEGGLATSSSSGESTPEYAFNVPLIPEAALKFNVAADTVVKANEGIKDLSGKQIVKEGDGELLIGGKSVVAGSIVHKKGTLRFSGEIGAPEGINQGAPVQNGPSCITIPGGIEGLTTILDGVIFHKPVWMAGRGDVDDRTVNWLRFGAASTNVFKEKAILHTNVGNLNMDSDTAMVFERGGEFNSTVYFRNGTLIVKGGRFAATTGNGLYLNSGAIRLESQGNQITLRGNSVRFADFMVDYAITNDFIQFDGGYTKINLYGTKQHCTAFRATSETEIHGGDKPAKIYIGEGNGNSANDSSYVYGKVYGLVSFEMAIDKTFSIYSDSKSTGDLEVQKGILNLGISYDKNGKVSSTGAWRNGTNIVVRGTGRLKTSVSDQFNRNHTVVKLSDDGVLEIPEGVRQTVYDLYVDGVKVPGGMYGGADAPDSVNKTYAKHFTGKGVLRVVRHGMMTIVVR